MGFVKLSRKLVEDARAHANANFRSIPKQIEHWTMIGKIAEENPDMTGEMILSCVASLAEIKAGKTAPYVAE